MKIESLLALLYTRLNEYSPWEGVCQDLMMGIAAACVSVQRADTVVARVVAATTNQADASPPRDAAMPSEACDAEPGAKLSIECEHGVMWLFRWQPHSGAPQDLRILETQLTPHLRILTNLIEQNAQWTRKLAGIEQAIQSVETGILVIRATGLVVQANAKAKALLLESPKNASDQQAWVPIAALQACIRCVIKTQITRHEKIHTDAGTTFFSVVPLSAPQGNLNAVVTVLVIAESTSHGRIASLSQLSELFSLSLAESELTRMLTLGMTLEEIAEQRTVRISTVRSQLSTVLSKTGARNQSALMRLISLIPAAR